MGKGSKQRPLKVPRKQFEDNWDKIFGTKRNISEEILEGLDHIKKEREKHDSATS